MSGTRTTRPRMERAQVQYHAFEVAQAIFEELVESDDRFADATTSWDEAVRQDGAALSFGEDVAIEETLGANGRTRDELLMLGRGFVDTMLRAGELKRVREERRDKEGK